MPTNQQRVDDGAEDVADFLERIRGLGDRSPTAEESQSRRIEDEILQGRKEREARRAERARSISPTKDSPLNTSSRQNIGLVSPRSPATPTHTFRATPSRAMADPEPRKSVDLVDKPESKTLSLNLDLEPSRPSPPPSGALSRQGTLSWQQRPSSRGGGSRPASLLSLDKPSQSPRATPAPEQNVNELSRADVAKSLESRDPTWFRQTADRGIGSAAYRKSQVSEVSNLAGSNVLLPGMSGRKDGNLDRTSNEKISKEPSPPIQAREFRNLQTMPSPRSTRSPLPTLPGQTFEPPQATATNRESSPNQLLAMSPAQRGISPERPASPTKGLGGFVQSAMLRRSDSLNKHKRASSQLTPALSRSNSVVSNNRESLIETPRELPATALKSGPDGSVRKSDVERPGSPSRTINSGRWSPTKQSWLEGALTKTDSPKSRPQSIPSTPMWLSELQKGKESNTNEPEKSQTYKPVAVGGFLRSPNEALKPASSLAAASTITNNRASRDSSRLTSSATMHIDGLGIKTNNAESMIEEAQAGTMPMAAKPESAANNSFKDSSPISKAQMPKSTSTTSPKPPLWKTSTEPPVTAPATKPREHKVDSVDIKPKPDIATKHDFRAGLRSVNRAGDKTKNDELEFKNVFGKLKKTETKNFIAPDELKDNILRGKTGLTVTAGPRVYEKKDEFKDSILKKKQEMKAGNSVKAKSPEPVIQAAIPEAIALRQRLAQKTSVDLSTDGQRSMPESKPILTRTQSAAESSLLIMDSVVKPPTGPKPHQKVSMEEPKTAEPSISDTTKPPATKQLSVQAEPKPIPLEKKTSAPAQLQGATISNKLADRFNPALAGILARGPPAVSSTVATPVRTISPTSFNDEPNPNSSTVPKKKLEHATKSRAKGPKRRAPGTVTTGSDAKEEKSELTRSMLSQGLSNRESETSGTPNASKSTAEVIADLSAGTPAFQAAKEKSPALKEKPSVATATSIESSAKELFSKPRSLETTMSEPVIAAATSIPKTPETSRQPDAISKFQNASPKSPKSPPPTGSKAKAMSRISSNGTADRLQIPIPGGTFSSFFDHVSLPKITTDFDTQALLRDNRPDEKIRTIRKEMWEITGDGKKLPLLQQDYILFEEKIYICRHHFEVDGKPGAEVYLWHGDQVPPSAVDDVQIFCRSEARDAGCRLTPLAEGKESSNFLEALGGIMITRRSDSATYMLCGRRHLGQIVFDEVEFSVNSLCSGFAFIIAAAGGDVYLWKGKGAHADEIGCGRLISMDLGLTGEIQEVEEGKEPPGLVAALGSVKLDSGYWSQKGNAYTTRLFIVNADARSRSNSALANFASNVWRRRPSASSLGETSNGTIKEISPYNQSDVAEDSVFVLDAFFEIFVIVGSQTRSKFGSFVTALNFAQEYGILSVSVQDRPSIPQGHVIFLGATGDLPAGVRTAFRKWDDRLQKQKNSWAAANVTMPLIEALCELEGFE